jgi:hypothetical protein
MAETAAQVMARNSAIRANILANAIPVIQNVKSGSATYTAGTPTTVNVLASNVGLIRRFYLEISATVDCGTNNYLPTMIGIPNILSNVQFIDQNNRLRINTTGAHLHYQACERRRRLFGAAATVAGMSDPSGFGANIAVQQGTGTVTTAGAAFKWIFEIPVVNSNTDLTGAVYANQTTSNNQIQFTFNPNMFAANAADSFNAAWVADATGATPTLTGITWTLYQDFLDQLPVDNTGFAVLPPIDIAYALCFQMINPGVQVQGVDNLYALPPFNVYQNLMLFWDNFGYSGLASSDIDYIKVQVANTYVLKQYDPYMLAVHTRNIVGADFPSQGTLASGKTPGAVYNLDFRAKPLSVSQLSSTNIVFNPNTVAAATSKLQIGQEYLWYANQAAA